MVLEKTLESPLDCEAIQSVHPKGDHLGCSLEGLIVSLKLQYCGHLMGRADSLEKTLMLGKIEGRRRGQHRMRWLGSITDSMDMNLSRLRERVKVSGAWQAIAQRIVPDLATEQQQQKDPKPNFKMNCK